MGTAHFLEFFPRTLIRVKLEIFARVNLLPEMAAFSVAAEHSHINPDRLIIVIKHNHPTLYGSRLAHITPLETLLERFDRQCGGGRRDYQRNSGHHGPTFCIQFHNRAPLNRT